MPRKSTLTPEERKERRRQYQRNYYMEHKEYFVQKKREWFARLSPEEKEKQLAFNRAKYAANKDKHAKYRAARWAAMTEEEREAQRARARAWSKNNPERRRATQRAWQDRHREQINASRCPFFKGHGRNELVCEGLVPRSSIILRYQSTGDKDMQSTLYCKGLYSYCEIYNMLMRAKYDEGDDVR